MRYFLRNEKYTCQVTSTWVVGQNIGNDGPFYPHYTYMIIRQYHQLIYFQSRKQSRDKYNTYRRQEASRLSSIPTHPGASCDSSSQLRRPFPICRRIPVVLTSRNWSHLGYPPMDWYFLPDRMPPKPFLERGDIPSWLLSRLEVEQLYESFLTKLCALLIGDHPTRIIVS